MDKVDWFAWLLSLGALAVGVKIVHHRTPRTTTPCRLSVNGEYLPRGS